MKENNIDTYLTEKNIYQNISITKNAIQQILFLVNSNSNNKGIRIGVKKSGCAGFRYTMKLVKHSELQNKKEKKEIVFSYKNILFYIYSEDMLFLEGVKIDFIKNNINKTFKFYNSKIEKFCGCGESFQAIEKSYQQSKQ